MFEIKITADTLPELASAILAVAENYRTIPAGGDAGDSPSTADAPKATRGRKSNAASAPADTVASEPSSPSDAKPTLVADEGNVSASAATSDDGAKSEDSTGGTTTSGSTTSTSSTATNTASPSEPKVSKDDAMAAAVKFSQSKGNDALETVLKQVGAINGEGQPRFSSLPEDKYGAFVAAMDNYAPQSALS